MNENYSLIQTEDADLKKPTTYKVIKNIFSGDENHIGYQELKKYKNLLIYTNRAKRYNNDIDRVIICKPSDRKDSTYIDIVFYKEDGIMYKFPENVMIPDEYAKYLFEKNGGVLDVTDTRETWYKKIIQYTEEYGDEYIEYSRCFDFINLILDVLNKYLKMSDVSDNYRKCIFYKNIKDYYDKYNKEVLDVSSNMISDLNYVCNPNTSQVSSSIEIKSTFSKFKDECNIIKNVLDKITTDLLESKKFKKVVSA